jgi:hypothetical protein
MGMGCDGHKVVYSNSAISLISFGVVSQFTLGPCLSRDTAFVFSRVACK